MLEWNDDKNAENLRKHGISFEEASLIFEGTVLSWTDARIDYGETRMISLGCIRALVAVAVVHTDRDGKTRIISACLANRRERSLFAKGDRTVLMTPLIFDSCITMPKQARLSWTPLFVSGWVT